jgi:hypothetical protein
MHGIHPCEPPRSRVGDPPSRDAGLRQVAGGQKLVIYSIVLNVVLFAFELRQASAAGAWLLMVLGLVDVVMAVAGVVRLCGGFGYWALSRVMLVAGCFVPLLNLMILVVLSRKATGRLRDAGCRVGLLGASRLA